MIECVIGRFHLRQHQELQYSILHGWYCGDAWWCSCHYRCDSETYLCISNIVMLYYCFVCHLNKDCLLYHTVP